MDRAEGAPPEVPVVDGHTGETIREAVEVPTFGGPGSTVPVGDVWREYRKKVTTRARRIEGPFRVWTSESENEPFYCEDGYLAIDARGYPYAIAAEEFALIYEPADA